MPVVRSYENDPYINLSLEEALFRGFSGKDPVLYLWINRPCVVIGRNQNAWRECNLKAMQDDGVLLVRRDSGGGAVYHDLGNLLFSVIMPPGSEAEDSYGLILRAVERLGIRAELRGRNDLVAGGKKFSGSAYMRTKQAFLHHGTMLVNTDMDKLSGYLNPSEEKIRAKGVASVRQRVVNLTQLCPDITMEAVCGALSRAFGCETTDDVILHTDMQAVTQRAKERKSWDFLYGTTPEFDIDLATRLPLGEVQLYLRAERARVCDVRVYTDALDAAFPEKVKAAFIGCRLRAGELSRAAAAVDADMAAWLADKNF